MRTVDSVVSAFFGLCAAFLLSADPAAATIRGLNADTCAISSRSLEVVSAKSWSVGGLFEGTLLLFIFIDAHSSMMGCRWRLE